MSRFVRLLPAVLVLLGAVILGACGEDPDSAPATSDPSGTPRPTPGGLLAGLAERVAVGEGTSVESWTAEVESAALALWPEDASADAQALRRLHANLAHITGDMAVHLASANDARSAWLERDAISVRIHDGFLKAAQGGVDAYRAWLADGGRALLEERKAELMGDGPPR